MTMTAHHTRTAARPAGFGARPDSFRADSLRTDSFRTSLYRADSYPAAPSRGGEGGSAPVVLALGAAAGAGAILGVLLAVLAAWLI